MKSLITRFLRISVIFFLLWALIYAYEVFFSNGDGVLARVNINVFFTYLGIFLGIFLLAIAGTSSKKTWLRDSSGSFLSLLIFLVLLEFLCFLLIQFNVVDAPRPFHSRFLIQEVWGADRSTLWGDISPEFGRWRLASTERYNSVCTGDSVLIRSNSFGMRDKERSLANTTGKKRVAIIGDSFVEGYIVDEDKRFSNVMETQTGVEHLNFGINSTSAINYFLIYKQLARKFEHDVVLVSLLPANDFEDYEESQKVGLLRFPIYRPYWAGTYPDVQLNYSLAHISQSISAKPQVIQPIEIQQVIDSVYHSLTFGQKVLAEISLNSYLYTCGLHWGKKLAGKKAEDFSGFKSDAFQHRWDAFAYSLEQLAQTAKDKKVIFYAVPILSELRAYDQDKRDDLSPRLEVLCKKYGIAYVNLLPIIHAQGAKKWETFYETCDGHWTPAGEAFVAQTLLNHPAYKKAMQD